MNRLFISIKNFLFAEKIIDTEAELNAVVDNDRFETVVKGGYMNMEIK